MSFSLDKSVWKRVSLGEVAAASKERVDPSDGTVARFVAGEHMDTDDLKIHRWGDATEVDLGPAFHRRFRPGQILYGSRRTYLRKVAVADFDGVCANTTFVVESKDNGLLLQQFLPFIMTAEPFHAFAVRESKGSVNPYVNWSDIARYEFDLPPLDEQKRIADLLWVGEEEVRARKALLAATEIAISDFCRATYQQIRRVAPSRPITDIAELRMGRQKSPKYATGKHSTPYMRVANIGVLELNLTEVDEMDFDVSDKAKFELRVGDVLLTEGDIVSAMNVGRPALVSDEAAGACFQNTLIRLRPSSRTSPEYLLAVCEGMRLTGVFAAAASTTTVTHLGLGRLSTIVVPDVPPKHQEEISVALRTLLHLRETARAALESARVVHATLRDELIGGA